MAAAITPPITTRIINRVRKIVTPVATDEVSARVMRIRAGIRR